MQKFPTSRLSEFTFYFECFYFLLLVFLMVNFNSYYMSLDGENGPIELPGAIALILTSGILLYSGFKLKKNPAIPKYRVALFFAAGLFFIFIAGEELSWGQHLTGHGTPEWLKEVNAQKETNVHNINKKSFDRWASRIIFLVGALSALFHFKGKEHLLGFRLPEAPLAMSFLLLPVYRNFSTIQTDLWDAGLIIFLIYFVMSILGKQTKMIVMGISFIVTGLIVFYFHRYHFHFWGNNSNIYHEMRESMFQFICLAYSIQLMGDVRRES